MANWKTTLFGALAAVGAYLQTQPGWIGTVGAILVPVATALLGFFAKDATKSPAPPVAA